ncbi:MAG: hypothetical protein EAZ89_08805 [Bacteroidetes bacterium]|nr:MAG: hypothetical protein EAZ89_08805 [Bacteroidota bacterium]
MNKVCLSLFLAVLIMGSAGKVKAQNIEIGLRAMPMFASFKLQNYLGASVKGKALPGIGAGMLLAYNHNRHVGIQAEVYYNSITVKYELPAVVQKINLRYLNIPVLLSLNTDRTQLVNVNMVMGLQAGINTSNSLRITGESNPAIPQALLSVQRGDLGFAYGAGVDVSLDRLRRLRLSAGYRGVYGLFDISDNNLELPADLYYLLDKSHVQTHSAYVGLSFLLGSAGWGEQSYRSTYLPK